MSSTNKWLKNLPDSCFFEIYKTWPEHGYGAMLVHYHEGKCEYVRFEAVDGSFKKILSDELLKKYYKEMRDDA